MKGVTLNEGGNVPNERGVRKICDFQPIWRWQSKTDHAV